MPKMPTSTVSRVKPTFPVGPIRGSSSWRRASKAPDWVTKFRKGLKMRNMKNSHIIFPQPSIMLSKMVPTGILANRPVMIAATIITRITKDAPPLVAIP